MKTMLGLLVLALPFNCLADVVVPVDSVENFVNVRQAPEAGSEIVGRLQKGIPLTLVQSVPGWNEVALDDEGTTGFVSADWSTVIPDEPVVEEAVEETVEEIVEEAVDDEAIDEAIRAPARKAAPDLQT